jgi:prephenate dehydratase
MNAKKRPNAETGENVLTLDDYRDARDASGESTTSAHAKRIAHVKNHVIKRLESRDSPAVAAAAAFVDADGNLGITAAGIEPEMAASLAHELHALANKIESHAAAHTRRRAPKSRTQRGAAGLLLISAVGFIAATYVNEVAWLDAALSLAAQLSASFLSRRIPE